ncbi:hypothetical protein ACI5KX_10160 [Erythrobacter sp. GH1-10]|uniref:hypothetical protein n=1 Tax=Erythrobacter sp. GH1-10 TaxID=3349334 RepID=UPI003877FE2E
MTRQLIAFLALLTGLAAFSGTTSVSYAMSASSCDASVSASAEKPASSEREQARRGPGKPSDSAKNPKAKRRTPTPISLRMPVLMGIDRAYE